MGTVYFQGVGVFWRETMMKAAKSEKPVGKNIIFEGVAKSDSRLAFNQYTL